MDFDFTLETISPNVSTLLNVGGTGALQLPSGITTARPGTAVAGAMRWNTTIPQLEYYNGAAWIASGGSVTSVTLTTGSTGLTVNAATSATITSSGTFTIAGTLATGYGGTGLASIGTANQIVGVNTGATGLEYKTLAAGGGIIVTPTAGSIAIATKMSATPTNLIYVSKAGNDTTGNGSWDNPFLTVLKGATVAATLATSLVQVTVIVLNGIYSETNPIAISNENVIIQGQDVGSVFIQPITNGQPLFNLSSATAGAGPSLNVLTVRGPAGYSAVAGGSLIRVSGDGYFELVQVYADNGYTAIDCGNGSISAGQTTEWVGGDADGNNITMNATSSAQLWVENTTIRTSITSAVQATGTSSITLNGFLLQGNLTTPVGTGINISGSATILATAGQIRGFVTGLLSAGTSNTRILSGYFANNTYDFNQSTSTAVVQIQGVYSATNPLITNGSIVSLNYIDINTNDYIVGSAVSTGVLGKVFRVRDYDGRLAVGDNATNANIASGGIGGSRSINLIDTNGNMRIWRYTADPAADPSVEIIKGINPANVDADGQAPIVSIATGTNTITVNVAGTNFNSPLDPTTPGIDRTTLAARAFPAGRIFQVNGTVANNGTFTVVSSTYNSGPQTISVVVTATIIAAGGAVGTVVFGGGAGRLDGPNPGNAAAAVTAGTGNVWWDSFLQESDYMVFRHRTGGGGSITNEKVRIYSDHSEWLGSSTYSDSDNALIFTAQNTAGAVNYLTIQNSVTTAPVLVNAAGTDTDVSISLVPKGAGLVTAGGTRGLVVPSGTTAQQPATPVNGTIRYNLTTTLMEFRQNGAWVNLGGSGTVTSVSTSSTTGLTLVTTNPTTTPSIVLAGTLNLASGGTNASLTALNGAVVYSTATAHAHTAAGTTGQVLTSNGAAAPTWATVGAASFSVNVGPAGTIAWTLVSDTTYTATITHNLGTQNVVVQTTDISNNQVTFADLITITSATQIIVQVSGTGSNLKTLRTVIIANGASIAAGASTPSSVIVQNNGVALTGTYTTLNLIGVLTATNAGAGVATITDTAGSTIRTLSYFATSLDSPNNADWVINALAPTVADPTNGGISVRQFSNTVEQGVGLSVPIPTGATNIIFTYRGRSASATAGTLQMRLYNRVLAAATPAAVGAWSAATNLTSVSSPANVFFQTFTQTSTLASLSLTAGNLYQFEFTRNIGVAGNLAFNWLMVELDIAFT